MKVKRLFNVGMVIMMLITSFAVSQPVAASAPVKFTPRIAVGAETVPGEVVVAFADSQGKNLVEKIEQAVDTANDAGGEVTRLSMDGSAVIQVDGDTSAALSELNAQSDVLYAEPNYVYSVPTTQSADSSYTAASDYVIRDVAPSSNTDGKSVMAVPKSAIQSMVAMGTYPSDTYLTNNQGWSVIGADIVWPNTTPSAGICEVDTGVDYLHPDISYTYTYSYTYYIKKKKKYIPYTGYATATASRVTAGYDFVNADADPMDDNGHGTHVAGIMVAMQNNGIGISGVSTGNVVAVKALDAQGIGTNFDIAKAVQFCADRTDVSVINLSLGGTAQSTALHDALLYATTPTTSLVAGGAFNGLPGKGKLVVAAAGNTNSATEIFPAGYSNDPEFATNRILSVASSGKVLVVGNDWDYSCKADTSNKNPTSPGSPWINIFAPGENIYSITPYDKPFYQNYYGAINTRYDYMSGTSMAAAFVSAAAARRMGYKPLETNSQIGSDVISTGDVMDSSCTINEMQAVPRVNVARLLDRAGVHVSVFDAASGLALNGASVLISYTDSGVAAYKTATLAPQTYNDTTGEEIDPARIFSYYKPFTDILDVPTKGADGLDITNYSLLVYMPGYTSGWQPAFQQDVIDATHRLVSGTFNAFTNGAVPPISSSFNVVLGWHKWRQVLTPGNPPTLYKDALNANDLDLYVWLPQAPGPDVNQPASFIVGYEGDAFGQMEGDSYGTLNGFPFARLKREGGFLDGGPTVESTTILNRAAHGAIPANAALPYYAGTYTIMATDYGQTIDHDNDGCGNNFGPNYTPTPAGCSGTPGIPLLGAYFTPYAYVWKDGVVSYFVDGSNNHAAWAANTTCNKHWWKGFTMTSAAVDVAPAFSTTFAPNAAVCDNGSAANYIPYVGYANQTGDRITISSFNK